MVDDKELEELEALVKEAGHEVPINEAQVFMKEMNLRSSDTEWVLAQEIYFRYLEWYYENDKGETPIYRDEFFKKGQFKDQFKCKIHHNGYGMMYAINRERIGLSDDEFKIMRMHFRDQQDKERKMKKWRASWKKYKQRLAKLRGNEKK